MPFVLKERNASSYADSTVGSELSQVETCSATDMLTTVDTNGWNIGVESVWDDLGKILCTLPQEVVRQVNKAPVKRYKQIAVHGRKNIYE